MTKSEALALCTELERLAGDTPGADPDGLRRVREVSFRLETAPEATAYIHIKTKRVARDFEVWLSARKWLRLGQDRARANLATSLSNLRGAIQAEWREGGEIA